MQFIYGAFAGDDVVDISTKEYAHLFKVRRVSSGSSLNFRNLNDDFLYTYEIVQIDKKSAKLQLISKELRKVTQSRYLHIGWCVVDPKTVEKTLPMLNEMGLSHLSFVYGDFSQKNFKIDMQRVERILINSSQQCGRSDFLKTDIYESVEDFLTQYPKCGVIDFCEETLESTCKEEILLVGPEGGFSESERKLFVPHQHYGLKSPMILRSESAVMGVCSKLLL